MNYLSTSIDLPNLDECTIAVLGLGYVGLPLAACFATTAKSVLNSNLLRRSVIGYDVNDRRVSELLQGDDRTLELTQSEIRHAQNCGLTFTNNSEDLVHADVFIVTVPTPIDDSKRPDLAPIRSASILVGETIKSRLSRHPNCKPIVIYESTVFPGATEEECVPLIEKYSGLVYNESFFVGYSPERLVPGDKKHGFRSITKVTSGSTPAAGQWINDFYASVVEAGTYLAPSLKVAEAAKVIENTQRDLNIALINELSMIFERLGIDTGDVLDAASTKWNFLPFRPGLVGGHCIGVDPYYLTYKAEQSGYYPQVVLAGRRINDGLADWLADRLVQNMAVKGLMISGAEILILGLTFKENCPDIRNSRVLQLIIALKKYGCSITVVDPWDSKDQLVSGLDVLPEIPSQLNIMLLLLLLVIVNSANGRFLNGRIFCVQMGC